MKQRDYEGPGPTWFARFVGVVALLVVMFLALSIPFIILTLFGWALRAVSH